MHKVEETHLLFLRFVWMFINLSTETVLNVFRHLIKPNDVSAFLKSFDIKRKIEELKKKKVLNKQEYDKVTTETETPDQFDLSLLITLIINLIPANELQPPKRGWDNPPRNCDTSLAADLLRLRKNRNMMVAHAPKAELVKEQFDKNWDEVTRILHRVQHDIAPEFVNRLKERIEYYRRTPIESSSSAIEDLLTEWRDTILKVQTEADRLLKVTSDFSRYSKNHNYDRYRQYICLLDKGGRFVLLSYLELKIDESRLDLKELLRRNESTLRKDIKDTEQLALLFPQNVSTSANMELKLQSLNISSLAIVILLMLSNDDEEIRKEIQYIKCAHETYADKAVEALDNLDDVSSELKASLKFISKFLLKKDRDKLYSLIEECKNAKLQCESSAECENNLKSQGIKTLKDVFKEKTKGLLQKLIDGDITFGSKEVIELKMITCGTSEEKTRLAEKVLVDVFKEALERSEDQQNFTSIEEEVHKILKEIRNKDIIGISIEQQCILLSVAIKSPAALLGLIEYFESEQFEEIVTKISHELGYHFGTVIQIQSCLTIESLHAILHYQGGRNLRSSKEISDNNQLLARDVSEKVVEENLVAERTKTENDETLTSDIEKDVLKKREYGNNDMDSSNDEFIILYKRRRRDCADTTDYSHDKESKTVFLHGFLLDMSFMKEKQQKDSKAIETQQEFILSQIKVVGDAVRFDLSMYNRIFAAAVGGSQGSGAFDIIGTLQSKEFRRFDPISVETLDNIFKHFDENGARITRKWVDRRVLRQTVLEHEAKLILSNLKSNRDFSRRFFADILPASCRDWGILGRFIQKMYAQIVSFYRQATAQEIREVVNRSMRTIEESVLVEVKNNAICSIHDAALCLVDSNGKGKATSRHQEILASLDPFIYGEKEMNSSLISICSLFKTSVSVYPNHQKILFVMSGGCSSEKVDIESIRGQLKEANAMIACFFTPFSTTADQIAYDSTEGTLDDGKRLLIELSSTFPQDQLSRAIFLQCGIDIHKENGKMFFHVKELCGLKQLCESVRNALSCRDSLFDLLPEVSLSTFINLAISGNASHEYRNQSFAKAVTTIIHLSIQRIGGEVDWYSDIQELLGEVSKLLDNGKQNRLLALQNILATYQLHCRSVDINLALKAVAAKRPVIATFNLTDEELAILTKFYDKDPFGILTSDDISSHEKLLDAILTEHSVLLTSFNSDCLRCMGFWGDKWADMGFLRVENADVLGLQFIDVYWDDEKATVDQSMRQNEVTENFERELMKVQTKQVTCPSCESKTKNFTLRGSTPLVECLLCGQIFPIAEDDKSQFALQVYLASLSR